MELKQPHTIKDKINSTVLSYLDQLVKLETFPSMQDLTNSLVDQLSDVLPLECRGGKT